MLVLVAKMALQTLRDARRKPSNPTQGGRGFTKTAGKCSASKPSDSTSALALANRDPPSVMMALSNRVSGVHEIGLDATPSRDTETVAL